MESIIIALLIAIVLTQIVMLRELAKRIRDTELNLANIVNNEVTVAKNKILNREDVIRLRNIDLSNVTLKEQWDKVAEEDEELRESNGTLNIIEEFWDTVQARLGILQKVGIYADEVMKHYPEHLEKLENRPR